MTQRSYDSEYLPVLEHLPVLDLADAAAVRAQVAALMTSDPMAAISEAIEVSRRQIPTQDGGEIELVIFAPRSRPTRNLPAILWLHGGGFVFGDANTDVRMPAHLAAELPAVVVSVNYRLAPENPFPTPLNDAWDALLWVAGVTDLGIDRDHLVVAGVSAGAALAAGVALRSRDHGGPALCFQALDTPVLDDRLDSVSMSEYTDTPMWTRRNAVQSWRHYLGADVDPDTTSPYAAPARAEDLAGLPATYLSVAAYDPLRDEAMTYAMRLTRAGVATELHLQPGTFHGATSLVPTAAASIRSIQAFTAAIARAVHS